MSLQTYSFVITMGGSAKKFYVGLLSELPVGNQGDLFFATDNGHFYSSNGIILTKILNTSDTPVPGAHATSHENGGSDEISVAGLSGLLADSQTALAHATSHIPGGSDAIPTGTSSSTLCIGDDSRLSDNRSPTAHKISHQDGGSDEISVLGLSGLLADAQTPTAHASNHAALGSDPITITEAQVTNLVSDLAAKLTSPIAESDVTGLISDLASKVASSRQIISGAGLTGGGDLSTDRTLVIGAGTGITVNADDIAVSYGTSASTACIGNDSRLSDSRAPTVHATSHAALGSDSLTLSESQITNLTTDLAAKALAATQIIAGAGLTGGGTLASDRTLTIGAGTGITVNADDIAVAYGIASGTACQGNDSRLSDSRVPTTHVTNHYPDGSDPILQFPTYPTTLGVSQTVLTGYNAWLNGTITIPAGITLTIQGTGQVQIGSSSTINLA